MHKELHQVANRVREFLTDNFGFRPGLTGVHDSDSLLDAGIIDSFGVLNLVMFLEEAFGIHVDDEEVVRDNLDSISNLTRFVGGKLCKVHER
jgi:acyl carrier protein